MGCAMSVLSLDEVKSHLNISRDDNDDELFDMIEAAEAVVAQKVGPLEPTTITSVVNTAGGSLRLPMLPVISVTSVSGALGSTIDPVDLTVNGATGAVSSAASIVGLPADAYTVTYTAGYPDGELPADLLLAVKEMVRHLWTSQRGGSRRPGSSGADDTPPAGYLIPNRVAELLAPHKTHGFGLI